MNNLFIYLSLRLILLLLKERKGKTGFQIGAKIGGKKHTKLRKEKKKNN